MKLKILEKFRTASLNSEFTGSYKKSVCEKLLVYNQSGYTYQQQHVAARCMLH